MLQDFVWWWCSLIGVTHAHSIETTVAIVAAAPLLLAGYLIFVLVMGALMSLMRL